MQTLSLIASLLASIFLIFTIIFVLVKDWRDRVNRYYAYFGFCSLGILFNMFLTYMMPESQYLTIINKLTQASTVLSFSGLFVLSLVFPKAEKQVSFPIVILILIPAYVLAYIAVFTDLNITKAYFQDGKLVREFEYFYTIYLVCVFFYILAAIINFIRKYIKTNIRIYRLQMRFVFIGTSIAMFIAAVFSIIMPRFFNYSELYVLGPSLATYIALSSLFYAIVSYNMMDIRTAIHKSTMYAIISTVIFIPIFGVIEIYDLNLWGVRDIPLYLLAAAVVVIFIIFSVYVQPIIDRVFKRKQYALEAMLNNFVVEVGGIRDLNQIVKRTVDTLVDAMFLKRAFFVMYDNNTRNYELFYTNGDEPEAPVLQRNSPVIRWFVRNQEILTLDRIYRDERSFADIQDEFITFFTINQVVVIIPVYHGRRVIGLMCLGEKDSLAAYKPDELELLQYFASESSLNISNAITYQESKQEQLVQRTIGLSSEILSKSVPSTLPNLIGIKFGAFYIPRQGEGIDYFDFIRPGTQGVGSIATDISGLGVNSAIYSVILRSAFQTCVNEAHSTYHVVQKLNRVLYEFTSGKGGFVTAFYYYFDVRSMRLIYTNAGFPPLELFRIDKNDFDSLDTEGIPIGYDPSASYGMGRTNILRGDIGVLYSKALTSSKNPRGETFGIDRLRSIIKDNRMDRPTEISMKIQEEFKSFIGLSSPESDIVVIIFKAY